MFLFHWDVVRELKGLVQKRFGMVTRKLWRKIDKSEPQDQ